jgi:hypothetical protein
MVTMGVTASCGTSSADPTSPGGGQSGTDLRAAAGSFVPSHLTEGMLFGGGPDVAVTGNPTTIDTDRRTIDGATSAYFVLRNGYAVLNANRVVFDHDVVITGSRPLIVVAEGDVTVSASIDLSAHAASSGPGAATFGPGEGGPGDVFVPGENKVSSGGGGGGHGSPGAPGGDPESEIIPPGVGGMVYGAQLADRLIGGAPGGAGGDSDGTGGGAGGGALQISSATSISITGPHIAAGGGGGRGGIGALAGAGGGAGGELFLEAPAITIASTLAANGGGGGGGGGQGGVHGGTNGADGQIGDAPAPGGIGDIPMGSDGGAGAAGSVAAQQGGGYNSIAGGGGGGAGRIWLRYEAATPPVTTGAVISPPPTLDPTLP